jgi:glycosyltransferase involved in cell wall biosynthesis
MRIRFVVPADVDSPTGGNVYDLAAADALRRGGDDVELVRVEPSGLAAGVKQPWSGSTLVDGLLACQQPEAVEASPTGILVHMPRVWQTDMTSDRAAGFEQLERRALHAAVVVVATSHWTARFLERHYGLRRVAVALPGVDVAPIVHGSEPPLFVHLAAMSPHKDQLGVVESLASLKDLPWQARLAGSVDRNAAYAAAVRDTVTAAGLVDRVEIAGELDRDIAWRGADLALLPSRAEAFGMVVTEALARGIPAVVAEGGPAEALGVDAEGNRPGVVIPAGDVDALSRELRLWLTDDNHRAALRDVARAGRATMDGWEVTAKCLRDALSAAP